MGEILAFSALAIFWFGMAAWLVWFGLTEGLWMAAAGGALLVVLGLGFGLMIHDDASDPHISLNETEWVCSESDLVVTPVLVGKVIVNQMRRVCTQYTRT